MPETQETIGRWADETFPGGDPLSPRSALRALEEMIELCLAAGAERMAIVDTVHAAVGNAPLRHPLSDPEKVQVEAADVVICLSVLAHRRGFDLNDHVEKKMAVNRGRKWHARGDGTGYHVKEQ